MASSSPTERLYLFDVPQTIVWIFGQVQSQGQQSRVEYRGTRWSMVPLLSMSIGPAPPPGRVVIIQHATSQIAEKAEEKEKQADSSHEYDEDDEEDEDEVARVDEPPRVYDTRFLAEED